MTEYVASVPRVELEPLLGLLPLAPFAVVALLLAGFARGGRLRAFARRSAWVGLALSGVLATWFAYRLSDSERILLDALAPSLRIGSLDVALVFELDRVRAWLLAGIAVVLSFVAARLSAKNGPDRTLLVTNVIGLGAVLTLLADNALYVLLGLWVLELGRSAHGPPHAQPFRPADATLLLGFAFLFWGQGGSWMSGEGFVPELRSRLAVIDRPATEGDAAPTLSLTSLPGAQLRLGGALLCEISPRGRPGGTGTTASPCWEVATAPFVDVPARAGVHTLTISAGPGTDELLIENLRLEKPREIIVTGPSLVFREIQGALGLRDEGGKRPFEATFARAELFGIPVAALVAALVAFWLGCKIGGLFPLGLRGAVRPFELAGVCCWLALLVRVSFLLDFAAPVFALAAAGGAIAAVAVAKLGDRLYAIPSSVARRLRSLDARIAGWLAAMTVVLVASGANAASSGLEIRPGSGSAPLELERKDGAYEAGFVVENRGKEPVVGLRLAVPQPAELVPVNPAGLSARFAGGMDTITLGPGEARPAIVRYSPSQRPTLREAYGHVLVVGPEGTHAALGVHLQTERDFLADHGLSLVLGCSVAGLLGIGASALFRYRRLRALRAGFVVIACVKLGLVLALWASFDKVISRLDGNGGYQFIERVLISRSLGLEYFVGVDGFGLAALLTLAAIFVLGSLVGLAIARDVPKFLTAALLLDLGLSLAVTAVDSALLLAALLMVVAGRLLFAPAGRVFRVVTCGGALAFVAGLALSFTAAPRGYLVDGTPNPGAPSVLDLAVGQASPPLLGVALIVIGSLALAGAPPFQFVNLALVRKLKSAAAPLAIAAVSAAMLHLLLRVGLGALPSGFVELAPYLTWFGVLSVAHAALACFQASDLVDATIYGFGGCAGLVLSGLASRTAIGIQGAELVAAGGSLALAGAFAVALAIDNRMPSAAPGEVRGVGAELVDLAVLSAPVIFGLSLAPVSLAFIGLVLVLIGCLPFQPLAGCMLALAAAALAVGLGRLWQRLFLGTFGEAQRKLPELEPHAGRLPALTARERFGLALVSLVSSTLGLWPRPLCDVTDGAAVDYAEPVNPPGPLQVSQTAQSIRRG